MDSKIARLLATALVTLLLLTLGACTRKEPSAPAKPARVSATGDYVKYFGPAPTTDKGSCFAFVIYFPSAAHPGKVIPFPFFTFDESSLHKVAVERLLSGMDLPAFRRETLQSFNAGTHLLGLSLDDGVVTVNLSGGFLKPGADGEGMLHALVMTLAQFPHVEGVRLLQEGKGLDFAPGPRKAEGEWVQEPGPPRLLSVTGVRDKGARDVEEVNAYFDRPVDIREMTIADRSGKPFAGEVYQSVFDMAAVLKPKEPALFKSGMPVKVHWKVTDKLGRSAAGDGDLTLEVLEH